MLPERQMKAKSKKLPPAIKSQRGLAAHLDALCAIAPEFKGIRVAAGEFSLRWYRTNSSLENRPCRSCGTRSSSFPTRVTKVRG